MPNYDAAPMQSCSLQTLSRQYFLRVDFRVLELIREDPPPNGMPALSTICTFQVFSHSGEAIPPNEGVRHAAHTAVPPLSEAAHLRQRPNYYKVS